MKIDLSGRVAVVTGSTRGIGRSIADVLTECGARVAVVGRDLTRAGEVADEIGHDAAGFACDVSVAAQAGALIEQVESSMGSVDILVNNAGVTRDNILLRLKDDDWDAVLDANLRGAFATMRAAARGMMKRRWGRMINISSIVGLTGNRGQANYAASKAGLIGLTKSVAKEFASRNILANVIAPGFIETDMTSSLPDEMRDKITSTAAAGRLGTPEDVAATAAFLASDGASYITGQVLVVDGGLML